ncbi:MAG: hypothetical protein QOE70_5737 [Chthoniobacter sp.]|jgi:hypothetical protein|nr:hypothetical protein [Chthoniobacter sp.]
MNNFGDGISEATESGKRGTAALAAEHFFWLRVSPLRGLLINSGFRGLASLDHGYSGVAAPRL